MKKSPLARSACYDTVFTYCPRCIMSEIEIHDLKGVKCFMPDCTNDAKQFIKSGHSVYLCQACWDYLVKGCKETSVEKALDFIKYRLAEGPAATVTDKYTFSSAAA